MTIGEKRATLLKYCEGLENCGDECIFYEKDCSFEFDDTVCESCYDQLMSAMIEENPPTLYRPELTTPHDTVNHPSHYCREGGIESIDEMVLVFGKEAVKHFCLCNIWKYRYRAADKNGEEDLKKSDWYMKKYKELCTNE